MMNYHRQRWEDVYFSFLIISFTSDFWLFFFNPKTGPLLPPCSSCLCCRLGSHWEVMEHRDQGTTRGQQQSSSLQSQLPPSTLESSRTWRVGETKSRVSGKRRIGRLVSCSTRWKKGSRAKGEGCDQSQFLLTAAPWARVLCSQQHATTQGRFLQLHASW